MPSIGSQFSVASVTVSGASTPTIDDLDMPLANTEYSYIFPTTARTVCIVNDASGIIQYKYASGGKSLPIHIGSTTIISGLSLTGPLTVYFESASAGQNIKFEYWE